MLPDTKDWLISIENKDKWGQQLKKMVANCLDQYKNVGTQIYEFNCDYFN
mgnify:CR=1 FL=1